MPECTWRQRQVSCPQPPATSLERERFIVFAGSSFHCELQILYILPPHVSHVGLLLRLFRKGHFLTSRFLCLLTGELTENKHWLVHGHSLFGGRPGGSGADRPLPSPSPSPMLASSLYVRRVISGCRVQGTVSVTCGILSSLPSLSYPRAGCLFCLSPPLLLFPLKTIRKETLLRVTQVWPPGGQETEREAGGWAVWASAGSQRTGHSLLTGSEAGEVVRLFPD